MPFYKLVKSASDAAVEEIVLAKDDAGKAISLSVNEAREIGEDLFDDAKKIAKRLGLLVVEAEAPEDSEQRQPVGDDVRGMSPVNVSGVDQPGSEAQPGAGTDDGSPAPTPPAAAPTTQRGSVPAAPSTTTP